MANVEDIKQELNEAKKQLEKAEAAVTAFDEDDNRGKWLNDLRTQLRLNTITERNEKRLDKLEEEKKGLDVEKAKRIAQVEELQRALTAAKAQPGNDFVTRRWGHKVVCT